MRLNIYSGCWWLLAAICVTGFDGVSAQSGKGFRPVALHIAPGNTGVLEYEGVPSAKGGDHIELPNGATPIGVNWSPTNKEGRGLVTPDTSSQVSRIAPTEGPKQTISLLLLRDSVQTQRPAGDFASLISLNIGRSVSVETFDGMESIGYSGTILGIDRGGEVLILASGQETHNIPVRQIMYWSAGPDWKYSQSVGEASRQILKIVAPTGWKEAPIRVWVEVSNLECTYSYRLMTGASPRLGLDVRLRLPCSMEGFALVGHTGRALHGVGRSAPPLFRLPSPAFSEAGIWTATAVETPVRVSLREEWALDAGELQEGAFKQVPRVNSRLHIRGNEPGDFLAIPLYIEHFNQPPLLVGLPTVAASDTEMHLALDRPLLAGFDAGMVLRGRRLVGGKKPSGPEGYWVEGQVELRNTAEVAVECTLTKACHPPVSAGSAFEVLEMESAEWNVGGGVLQQSLTLDPGKPRQLRYKYFVAPVPVSKK